MKRINNIIYTIYYLILILFLFASFYPNYRIWGFNHWAYYTVYVPLILFGIGVMIPMILHLVTRFRKDTPCQETDSQKGTKNYFIISTMIIIIFGVAFYLLRGRTHFLGDGYMLLSNLGSINPLIKFRNIGETLIHIFLYNQLKGAESSRALLSYQLLSYAGGLIFLSVAALSGKALFKQTIARILFLLGLGSGGYMLLFFGYVENYSLFVTMVAVYSLMGLLTVKGRLNRWLILIPLALSIFFHIFGVALIPSAVYLLLINTKLSAALLRLNKWVKFILISVAFIIICSIFYYYYTTELFFRFAFVPLIENRFTVEGYTLFSLNHLLDIINFVILLLPAFPILITLLFLLPVKKIFIQQDYKFLLILLMSVLGVIFIFDPKMGMPRDWDLFSFVGVPLVLFCFYLLLDSKILIQNYMPLTIMAIVLNLFLLVPRVVSQINPDISIAHLKNYFTLDKIKNRTARFPLINYYESVYDIVSANKVRNERDKNFPERFLGYKGVELLNKGKYLDAIPYFEEMMKKNPIFYDPYNNLAVCLLSLKYTDSALTLLEIADGLNPYNIQTYYNIATCYYDKNQFNKAERWWQKAIDLDDTFFEPYLDLLALYKKLNLKEEYFKYFLQAAAHNEAPLEFIVESGNYYLKQREYIKARFAFARALSKGLDSAYVKQLEKKYPQLVE